MAGINQLFNLMLCILEVYSLPTTFSDKHGGSSSLIVMYQQLNCGDQAASTA